MDDKFINILASLILIKGNYCSLFTIDNYFFHSPHISLSFFTNKQA